MNPFVKFLAAVATATQGFRALSRIALRGVLRNWRHSLASLLSLVTGFLAITLFSGFLKDVLDQYDDNFPRRGMLGSLVIQKKGAAEHVREDIWKYSLDEKEQAVVDGYLTTHAAQVETRVRFLELAGLVSNGRHGNIFVGYGLDVEDGAKMRGERWEWNTLTGRPLRAGDTNAVVLGKSLGTILECDTEPKGNYELPNGGYVPEERPWSCAKGLRFTLQASTESAQANLIDVTPVGFMDAGIRELDNKYVVMPLPLAWELTDSRKVSRYTVKLSDSLSEKQVRAFGTSLQAAAATQGVELDALPWKEHPFGELYRRTVTLLGIFRAFV